MKIKLFMTSVLLAIGSTAVMAQASYTDKDGNEYQFKRHWFLDIQAGGQYTVGEAEGWFHTGDLGAFTADGELLVLGRRDNRFICGGENIQPEAIEQALLQHGAVRQALVVPLADAEWVRRRHGCVY